MTINEELKRKITKRWNIISDHQRSNPCQGIGPIESTAFAQLEYILIEAGLLAERRVGRQRTIKFPEETQTQSA